MSFDIIHKKGWNVERSNSDLSFSKQSSIIHLQETFGNQVVQHLIRAGVVQTKLSVSQPGDIYEQEADRVAEQVMRITDVQEDVASLSTTNDEIIGRKCQSCQEEEETEMNISRKSNDGDESKISENVEQHVTDAILSKGSPLESNTRDFMESRFGFDFGNIRIHTDEGSAKYARALNALAYTVGNNIIFETGRYEPHRPDGMKLLARDRFIQYNRLNLLQDQYILKRILEI